MNIRTVYSVESLPVLQNRGYATEREAKNSPRGVMNLVQDMDTGLIRNAAFDPSLLVYDQNYQIEQALSPIFQDHLDAVAEIVERFFTGLNLVEIGCGKGRFLELLRSRGFQVVGVDPAYEGDCANVIKAPFSPDLGLRAQAIVLRHVLEHIPDPLAFLESVAETNGRSGLVYIEVPCLEWIAQRRAWFDIYYEHVNYFRKDDLTAMFGAVLDAGHLFGGQYLYVVADLATLRRPHRRPGDRFELPEDFLSAVDHASRILAGRGAKKAVVWGGSSKGVIFTLFMQQRGMAFDYVIDINPAKQGRYLAATGYRVDAPEKIVPLLGQEDMIFIMNSNYSGEILASAGPNFRYIRVDHDRL